MQKSLQQNEIAAGKEVPVQGVDYETKLEQEKDFTEALIPVDDSKIEKKA